MRRNDVQEWPGKLGSRRRGEQGAHLQKLRRSGILARTDGFTLVEMLVVLAIIDLIIGSVGPRVLTYLSESKMKTTRIQIEELSAALDLYHLDKGNYPFSDMGLTALVRRPEGLAIWNGPYLKGTTVPNDP
jgi:general secretion pathway protein G